MATHPLLPPGWLPTVVTEPFVTSADSTDDADDEATFVLDPRRVVSAEPPPSAEQERIVEDVLAGFNVKIIARAGCGKTSTCVYIGLRTTLRMLVVTYNRSLANDTSFRLHAAGLGARARCVTIHSLVGRCAGRVGGVRTDADLLATLDGWRARGGVDDASFVENYDLIVVDEAQDLRPSYYEALMHALPLATARLVVMGDPKQTLYDYDAHDAATPMYLQQAELRFAPPVGYDGPARAWRTRQLSVSYRLTPRIARFVNTVWGTDIVGGNRTEADVPVEYWVVHPFPRAGGGPRDVATRLCAVLEAYPPEDVMILNPFNLAGEKRYPLRVVLNELLERRDRLGRRMFNFHVASDPSDTVNKVRAWTYCKSKGTTVRVVVVLGFDAFRRQPHLNQICVALSRASHRLIVVHGTEHASGADGAWRERPLPYVAPLGFETLGALVHAGVVDAVDGVPPDPPSRVGDVEPCALSVTGNESVSAASVRLMLARGRCALVRSASPTPTELRTTITRFTGALPTREDVSAVYGTAVPYALEWTRAGRIAEVEAVLRPLFVGRSGVVTLDAFERELRCYGDLVLSPGERHSLACFLLTSAQPRSVVQWLATNRALFPSLSGHRVYDAVRGDKQFCAHALRLTEAYARLRLAGRERTRDVASRLMYLASACNALGGVHAHFVQLGDGFDWVDADAFWAAVGALDTAVGAGELAFEVTYRVALEPAVWGRIYRYESITGRVDAACAERIYEFKTTHRLTEEHRLQALMYAALRCLDENRPSAETVLVSSLTGETWSLSVDFDVAQRLVAEFAQVVAVA